MFAFTVQPNSQKTAEPNVYPALRGVYRTALTSCPQSAFLPVNTCMP